jgi:hypothetical protein
MTKTKTGQLYISEKATNFIDNWFEKRNPGIEFILETFYYSFNHALNEIKGKFTENELNLIIDAFNGTLLTTQIMGQHLQPQVEDGCSFEFLNDKWDVSKKDLLKKISELTNFQAAAIEIWASALWQKHHGTKMEEFKKILL